jgi:hypothetical protein
VVAAFGAPRGAALLRTVAWRVGPAASSVLVSTATVEPGKARSTERRDHQGAPHRALRRASSSRDSGAPIRVGSSWGFALGVFSVRPVHTCRPSRTRVRLSSCGTWASGRRAPLRRSFPRRGSLTRQWMTGSFAGPHNLRLHLTALREPSVPIQSAANRRRRLHSRASRFARRVALVYGRRGRASGLACGTPRPERTRSAAGEPDR